MAPADFYVYLHREADTGRAFYVGKGRARRAYVRSGRSEHWSRIAAKHGFAVTILADGLTEAQAFALEVETIAAHSGLCNATEGGEGIAGYQHTEETKRRLHDAHAGRTQPADVVARRAASLRGKKRAPGFGEVVAARNRARPVTDETRAKMSEAHKARPRTEAGIAKTAEWHRGRKRSAEAIARMKAASAVKRAVTCVDRALTFESLADAAEWLRSLGHLKASKAAVGNCASGRVASSYGFRWVYAA